MKENIITLRDDVTEIFYRDFGVGTTTLLFVHGWCINGDYWADQQAHFGDRYRTIAIDLPGFGKSTAKRTEWTIEEYAQDILAFIEALQLKHVIFVGHSMSVEIMIEVAATGNAAIIGLVGIDNLKFIDVQMSEEDAAGMKASFDQMKTDFRKYAPLSADTMLFHPHSPEFAKDRVKADIANTDPHIGYSAIMNLMAYSAHESETLDRLPLQLHLISADTPPTNEAGLLKHCKHGFTIQYMKEMGHYPMIERPEEFNRLLEKAIYEIED